MQNRRKPNAGDFVFGILLVIGAIAIMVYSVLLGIRQQTTFTLSAGFFPFLVGIVLCGTGIALAITGVRHGGVQEAKEVFTGEYLKWFFTNDRSVRAIILALFMYIYIFRLIGHLPFMEATFYYLFGTMMYLKAGKWWKCLIISLLAAAAIGCAFRFGFGINLPGGFDVHLP